MSFSVRSSIERVLTPRSSLEKALLLLRGRGSRSRDFGNTVPNWRLPAEVLLRIFSSFSCPQEPEEDAWLPGYHQEFAARITLLAAMLVCRAWHSPARDVFYSRVEPRTVAACVSLAQTLSKQPRLALRVQQLVLPEKTKLMANSSVTYVKLAIKTRYRLHRLASDLERAVHEIVARCKRLEDVRISSGTDDVANITALSHVSGHLRSLSVNLQFLYAEDELDVDETHAVARGRMLLSGRSVFRRVFRFDRTRFESLEVLRLSRFWQGGVPAPVGVTADRFGQTFPKLRMLALSHAVVGIDDLKTLLAALSPRLRTLSLLNITISSRDECGHPLPILLSGLIPSESLNAITDLRVLSGTPSTTSQPSRETVNWKFDSGLVNVTHLTLDPTQLAQLNSIPASLQELTLYYLRDDRRLSTVLATVGHLARAIRGWRESAPSFARVVQRVPNTRLRELSDWSIVCEMMCNICSRSGITVSTQIWLNRVSVETCTLNQRAEKQLQSYELIPIDCSVWNSWPGRFVEL
ncbi:hypothetical protein BKA62DRAFT_709452 [Auriculariales sp. MPI-PUGE-AT-0066]|nr:hypothetical protein BKA62DRAFT_709452 [Auriculariales sp. MPI-PUGE-AT-0066]